MDCYATVRITFMALLWHQAQCQCADNHNLCGFWSGINECQTNPDWMLPNCALSCGQCRGQSRPQPQQPRPQPQPQPQAQAQPNPAPQQRFGNCGEIRNNNMDKAIDLLRDQNLIVSQEDFRRPMVDLNQVKNSNTQFGCAPTVSPPNCEANLCYNLAFRTLDGTCNHLNNPTSGAAFQGFMRLLAPNYDDGQGAIVSSIRNFRPSARDVSSNVVRSNLLVSSNQANVLVMQWGQFLTHDMARTTQLPNNCGSCGASTGNCANIFVQNFDQNSRTFGCDGGGCCIKLPRATPVCGRNPREQFNENTPYIDGSVIYSSSTNDLNRLRTGPFMRTEFRNGANWMPTDGGTNFISGDERVNMFVGLAAMHTVFVREHNRVASQLQRINPGWDQDRLFQEARKIVGAEIQAITYNQYLPKVLGSGVSGFLKPYSGFQANVDPAVSDEFSAGAFRFGHGMLNEFYDRLGPDGRSIPQGGIRLLDAIFQPQKLIFEGGADGILRGMMNQPAKLPQRITTSATEFLFGNQDLASVNIQRGRDQGLGSYNDYRQFCGLSRANTFEDLSAQIADAGVRNQLARTYGNPANIDFYAGAIVEDPVSGGLVGPTLACIIADQFRRTRDGDRFWYQNSGIFTSAQRAELEKASLARILCDNGENFQFAANDIFGLQQATSCQNIPFVNLQQWAQR